MESRAARLTLMVVVFGVTAAAQTPSLIPFKLNFTGSGMGNGQTGLQLNGSGNLDPFGPASVSISITLAEKKLDVSFVFTVGNSGSLTASVTNPAQAPDGGVFGTATVLSGTGIFAAATGGFFAFSIAAPPGTTGRFVAFTLTGSGGIGGVPGFEGSGSSGGSVLVFNDAAVVGFDGSGLGSGVLVFEGSSGGNGLNFDGSGGGSSVLVFDGDGGSASGVRVRAADSGGSLHIALPPQPVATGYTAVSSCPNTPGPCWITMATPPGILPAFSSAVLTAIVSPRGFAPGVYYANVTITLSTGRSLNIPVKMLITASGPMLALSQTGLRFDHTLAVLASSMQTISVINSRPGPWSFTATPSTLSGGNWLTVSQTSPTVENIQANSRGLALGRYFGRVDFSAPGGVNSPQSVEVVLNVLPAPPTAQVAGPAAIVTSPGLAPGPCAPTRLLPDLIGLQQGFQTSAGLPVPLQAKVVDNCGTPLNTGSVVAIFSTGDPSVSMTALGNGQWSGTWMPHGVEGGPAGIALNATSFAPALQGAMSWSGTLVPDRAVPIVALGGVLSAASFTHTTIAPGSFLSIFGADLAPSPAASDSLPLRTTLVGTQVIVGGQALPLQFVSPGQINAIAPYNVPANTLQHLLVAQNGAYSLPETVIAARAQPAVFTQSQSGHGAGVIVVVKPDGTQFEATAANPASAGDALVIYSAGLGAVDPPVLDGSASPGSPLANTVNPVTAMIGGRPAQVLFAGLAPGFAGLYQVNAIVPSGVPANPDAQVVLSVGGAISATVTVALR